MKGTFKSVIASVGMFAFSACAGSDFEVVPPSEPSANQVISAELALIDPPQKANAFSQCGDELDYVDVDDFVGSQKFTQQENQTWSPRIVQFQWSSPDKTDAWFDTVSQDIVIEPQEISPSLIPIEWGNVADYRWCTGGVIDVEQRLILTAAHCFQPKVKPFPGARAWQTPYVDGGLLGASDIVLSSSDIAQLFQVNWFYQGETDEKARANETASGPTAVSRLVEYGFDHPSRLDYAIVQLENTEQSRELLQQVGELQIQTSSFSVGDEVIINQHPAGLRKKVMYGKTVPKPSDAAHDGIFYNELDTLAGASGSPVLDEDGDIVGVHILGGCKEGQISDKLANSAVPMSLISAISSELSK